MKRRGTLRLLVIAPIVDNPKVEYIYSLFFIIGGALTYIPFVRYRLKMPFMGEIFQIKTHAYDAFILCRCLNNSHNTFQGK